MMGSAVSTAEQMLVVGPACETEIQRAGFLGVRCTSATVITISGDDISGAAVR